MPNPVGSRRPIVISGDDSVGGDSALSFIRRCTVADNCGDCGNGVRVMTDVDPGP
jgi:hypothetical protein